MSKKSRDFCFSSREEAKEYGSLVLLSNVEKLFFKSFFLFSIGLLASRQWLDLPAYLIAYFSDHIRSYQMLVCPFGQRCLKNCDCGEANQCCHNLSIYLRPPKTEHMMTAPFERLKQGSTTLPFSMADSQLLGLGIKPWQWKLPHTAGCNKTNIEIRNDDMMIWFTILATLLHM